MFHALICKCKNTVFVYVNGTQYMCIDFNGHHSVGSSFVYVNDFVITENFCTPTGTSSALKKKKKKTGKESQFGLVPLFLLGGG